MPRFRASGSSILHRLTVPQLRRKALNSWAAVQGTFYATKEIFDNHKIVFTVSTSIASVATAWAGYSLRHFHESRVDQRLESIEKAMKNNHPMQDPELKKLVSGTMSLPACVATAGTTLIVGYGLGWRGGTWYANRKFRKEQMKLLGLIKPKRWPLKFLRRPFVRFKLPENAAKISESSPPDASVSTRNQSRS
ncbi:uncharacterized protein [Primulina huaijiensis]|uniref:uncharacterized protein n=1 Tax=Primulina huaijiensis TaxID=1492673 RepID=UPI003CC71DB8